MVHPAHVRKIFCYSFGRQKDAERFAILRVDEKESEK
jgi:hypothetical protein